MRKRSFWITNFKLIAEVLRVICESSRPSHRDMIFITVKPFVNGCFAERYPRRLVLAVLEALRQELQLRGDLGALEVGPDLDEPVVWQVHLEQYAKVWNLATGRPLDLALVVPEGFVGQRRDSARPGRGPSLWSG